MGRPKVSENQRLRAYDLYLQRFGPSQIRKRLEEDFGELETVVSLRTVKNWIRQFKDIVEADKSLDVPFEWHRLEEYVLPWEASPYLLKMWAFVQEGGVIMPRPTFRQVRWWWRVHLAAPEMNKFNVCHLAQRFVHRELASLVLGVTLELADLEAYLAYRPWASDSKRHAYFLAVERKRIAPLKDREQMIGDAIAISEKTGLTTDLEFTTTAVGNLAAPSDLLPDAQWGLIFREEEAK